MNELHWTSATELAAAIARRDVASREVLDHLVQRIDALDGSINAVVTSDIERAAAAAAAADERAANDDDLPPLHGVPMTVKDSFQTAGCTTTSGAPELADFVPDVDAAPVARLREAGAIPFAKTNLPIFAGDIQSFNEVFGTTNNPFDTARTCGGSSGGSGAALSMGFTPIELGSDIAGSIRTPSAWCGVVGHKPTFGIVPAHGQIPGPPGTLSQADLAVAGPMARNVDDLEVMLDVLAGPDRWNAPAWRLELPPPRAAALGELRLGAWIDDDVCPVDDDTRAALTGIVESLRSAGATVDDTARPFTLDKAWAVFSGLLFAALSGGHPKDKIERLAAEADPSPLGDAKRLTAARHRDWLSLNERRLQMRARFGEFFERYDALLLPTQPRTAIPHDHSDPQWGRTVDIGGSERPYTDLFQWIAPAGLALLPATVVPVGVGRDGLPIAVQIVGPHLEDRTPLQVARLISELTGGCPRPAAAT
ncbi:MAG: amidase [Ilumatobacteraceae bacterium]|nr:amidase [Ilumatobacteraceae bacterium]